MQYVFNVVCYYFYKIKDLLQIISVGVFNVSIDIIGKFIVMYLGIVCKNCCICYILKLFSDKCW